ncbi:peptidase M1 [Marmoricola endophyticus]|uniref:Aminopeptidase N n=1 Tax=Marmoricola endophyticus TaxID=2040280 RepID=A0A917BKF7_9ACTN|nr:M1 family metallopeptidase [Marmoricola endophyticus]GGF47536.1 peptidase M1 [Marmoricola endophyticus]
MTAGASAGTDAYVPDHGDASFSVTHYALDLAYRPSGNGLSGTAMLTCRAEEELGSLSLDLHHLTPSKVRVDGRAPAKFTARRGRLRITLARPVAAGAELTVFVKYAGNPRPVRKRHLGEAGWEELTDGVIVASQPHGAPSWFPCNDRPDDKATYDVSLSVPAEYHVAGNGPAGRPSRSGATRTWRFAMDEPMATYLATLQVGRYVVHEQDGPVPMSVVAPADVGGPDFDASFGRQPEMMAAYVERFGAYPFSSYTSVITDDDLEIPLESQSLSTFGRNFVSADWSRERLVAHEMAHQWFGNAVTLRHWRDIWLHEGFACYAEWLWSEASGRGTAASHAAEHHARLAAQPQDLLLADPGPDLMFDDRVYKRGALLLHSLRTRVGDQRFFDLLRSWVAAHRGGSVTSDDFVAHCGGDVADLFDAWLRQEALPALP